MSVISRALFAVILLFPVSAFASVTEVPDLSISGMFLQADWVVKSVMIALVAASVISWSLFLAKHFELKSSVSSCQELNGIIRESERLSAIPGVSYEQTESRLIQEVMDELRCSQELPGLEKRAAERLRITETELTSRIASGTGVLASIGAVAPFIGLFGTVWGIMNSFIGIAASNSTNLAVVAPGIAEALLATAAGLLAAIPAVLFYNYFSRKISEYNQMLRSTSSSLMLLVSRYTDEIQMNSAEQNNAVQAVRSA